MKTLEKWTPLLEVPLTKNPIKKTYSKSLTQIALDAIRKNDVLLLEECLNKGLSPNTTDKSLTLIEYAIRKNKWDVTQLLRKSGAHLEINEEHSSLLSCAVKNNNLKLFDFLMKEGLSLKDSWNDVSFYIPKSPSIGEWLLKNNHFVESNWDAENFDIFTLMENWVETGLQHWDFSTLEILNQKLSGILNKKDKSNLWSSLWSNLIYNEDLEKMQKAIQMGWVIQSKNENPIMMALHANKIKSIDFLAKSPLLLEEAKELWLANPYVFFLPRVFEKLVKLGFDVSIKEPKELRTGLHYLCLNDALNESRLRYFFENHPHLFDEQDIYLDKPFDCLNEKSKEFWTSRKEKIQLEKATTKIVKSLGHRLKSKPKSKFL